MKKVKMPVTRQGKTHKIKLQDMSIFVTVNTDKKGRVMEVFSTERTNLRGELDGLAGLTSIALRHGTPLKAIVEFLRFRRYEPEGWINQPTSPSDALGRVLESYLPKDEQL